MTSLPLIFYGASGHALAVASQVQQSYRGGVGEILGFIDDFRGDQGESLGGAPIISFEHWRSHFRDAVCFITVGDPKLRIQLAGRIAGAGGQFGTFNEPALSVATDLVVGSGSTVGVQNYIGTRSRIGDHVQLMPNCSIGHDVVIGDYATICPSVTLSGYVHVGRAAFIGAGAVVVPGRPDRPLVIGEGSLVHAGAVVTKSVPPFAKVAGNPARPLRELARRR